MLPLSQEMSVSHGLCLLQEKQQATWESAGSHDLYQRFLSEPIRQRASPMEGVDICSLVLPNQDLLWFLCTAKLSFKVDRAVWNVKVLSRCLIINPNCRVNEKHGLIIIFVR